LSGEAAREESGQAGSESKYFESPVVQRLLRRIRDGSITEILPQFDPTEQAVEYPFAEQATGLNHEQVRVALDLLSAKGILSREPWESFFTCPQCGSKNLTLRLRCPNCEVEAVSSSRGLEHMHCGYSDLEDAFKTPKGLLCPNCKKGMKALGVDYKRISVLFKCMQCGRRSTSMTQSFYCNNCRSRSSQADVRLDVYYAYRVNQESVERMRKYLLDLDAMRDSLEAKGFNCSFEVELTGRSGLKHALDLVAWRFDEGSQSRPDLIAEISLKESPLEEDAVSVFITKMRDLDCSKGVIVAVPGSTEGARKLASFYGVKLKECASVADVPAQFESAVSELLLSAAPAGSVGREETQAVEESDDSPEVSDSLVSMMYEKQEETLRLLRRLSDRTKSDFRRLEELLKRLP
jgi:Zn finger protein HypA/HybF involved in hydrogenase expression